MRIELMKGDILEVSAPILNNAFSLKFVVFQTECILCVV